MWVNILGYGFVPTYKKGGKGKYNLRVNPKNFELLKEKVKAITRKTTAKTFDDRIAELNALMRGWVNYFKLASMKQKLQELDAWIRNRLRYCIWKQWKKPNRRKRAFIQLGINKEDACRWSRSRLSGWRIAQSPIMVTTITLERLKRRGYISFEETFVKIVHV